MLREADRGDAFGRAVTIHRRLNIGGERLAIGVDARLARGADPVARRIGFLHHRADEAGIVFGGAVEHRSEEQTSELQSLMRISYAGLCLKKQQQIRATRNTKKYR